MSLVYNAQYMLKFNKFYIGKYKAIVESYVSILNEPVPLIGVNESGKSSALEAIARFDYRNDTIAEQKNWKFINRYIPNENIFDVSADVSLDTPEDLQDIVDKYSEDEKIEIEVLTTQIVSTKKMSLKRIFERGGSGLPLRYNLNDEESPLIERLCRDILLQLPKIFYFDNFLEDQFPDKVTFPSEYFSNPDFVLTEYQSIIEGMFAEAEVSLKSFLEESDDNTKQTQISEVNRLTTNKMIGEWQYKAT